MNALLRTLPVPHLSRHLPTALFLIFLCLLCGTAGNAHAISAPTITFGMGDADNPQQMSSALQLLFILTVLSMAPAILLMTTCFVRIIIVLGFIRQAMSTQNMPPTQVLVGLAMFLTFFIMSPVINDINTNALQPYLADQINQQTAFNKALVPMRTFMFSQVGDSELRLLTDLTMETPPDDEASVPTTTLIPAFMLSEIKRAFQMGFLIYIPFLVIDMIVASILMSMGMMMLPPVIISTPFKLLLFVLVDGWTLVVGSLIKSFGS